MLTATAALISALTTCATIALLVRYAHRLKVIDEPNERSSHVVPTPRGAGLGVISGVMTGGIVLALENALTPRIVQVMTVAMVLVGGIGYLDDRGHVELRARLAIHIAAALLALYCMDQNFLDPRPESWVVTVTLTAGIVWGLNLYNFMDGIDGMALQQSIFLSTASIVLVPADSVWVPVLWCVITASLAVLYWNWAPARIFLGDSGSGFLGFTFACIATDSILSGDIGVSVWLILWGTFLVDASVTLTTRFLTGQKWYLAHRSHAYQRLARRFGSHSRVSAGVFALNWTWLFPWAYLAHTDRIDAAICVIAALAPIAVGVAYVGAGRSDEAIRDGPA